MPLFVISQVKVVGTLIPNNPLDKYPVVDAKYIKGGFMTVSDTNFMKDYPGDDSQRGITVERRTEGMLVYVQDIDAYYQLIGGTANENWTEVTFGGGTTLYLDTDRPTNYIGDGITIGNSNMRLDSAISALLYADGPPGASINGDVSNTLELGQSVNINLSWVATKVGTTDIDGITVGGQTVVPTGDTQNGVKTVSATSTTTYTIVVTAGAQSASDSETYTFVNRLYIGMIDGLGNPLDYPFVEPAGNTSSPYYLLADSYIRNTSNFPYYSLKSDYPTGTTSLDNSSAPARLVVVAPTSFGEPEVSVNGSFYSDMVLQKKWNMVNQYGYSGTEYKMWVLYAEQKADPYIIYIRAK